MRTRLLGAAALLLAALPVSPGSPAHADTPGLDAAMAAEAQAVFDGIAENYPALNVTVMQAGEIIWEAEGGIMRDALDGVERDYNAYSVAKLLTGLAFARLVDETGLDLDRSILEIDPALPQTYRDISLRQVLSHTAGIRGYQGEADWRGFNDLRCETPADALAYFADDPLIGTPGAQHVYTTYGFALASHLLVVLTGTTSFDAAMQAALGDIYRASTDRDGADKAVTWFGDAPDWSEISLSAECKFGGGGLIMSSRDLAAMGSDFAAGDVIALDEMDEYLQPVMLSDGEAVSYVFGMGTGRDEDSGMRYAAHSGGSPGGRSFILVMVEPQLVIAATGNADSIRLDQLAIPLSSIFLGGE